jgi:hypothetical protein
MRRLLLAALSVVVLSVGAACDDIERHSALEAGDWRTESGTALSGGEFSALLRACTPRATVAEIDPRAPAGAGDLNPAYRPGGEGLINSTPTGIAAANAPRALYLARVPRPETSIETCLEGKGLRRVD